jgi:carbon monoxide dehydrogenase subunit G
MAVQTGWRTVEVMARYVTRVRTPLSPEDAFDLLADLRTMADWDPGVRGVTQVIGTGPGPGATYDVLVAAFPRDLTFRYEVSDLDRPREVRIRAVTTLFESVDRISVQADGDGSIVTYDADLRLRGPLGLADPLLGLAFGPIGDRAAAGLARTLDGTATRG